MRLFTAGCVVTGTEDDNDTMTHKFVSGPDKLVTISKRFDAELTIDQGLRGRIELRCIDDPELRRTLLNWQLHGRRLKITIETDDQD
jgi:hypothetical protein